MIIFLFAVPEAENAVVGDAAVSEVSGPGVVVVVAASIVGAAGLRASAGILVAFAVFVVSFVAVVEAGNYGHPRFRVFANTYLYAILSSSG